MKNVTAFAFILTALACLCFGDNTKTVAYEPVPSYTFHCRVAEQCASLERREQMMRLLAATIDDEYNGIHDVAKFRQIKELAKKLEN
jgi:hypothetical protein